MIEQLPSSGKVLAFKLSGKLHDEDYEQFVPVVDAAARDERVRLLVVFENFRGWDARALWDDIKFATTHCTKFDRIALVGDTTWEKWMAKVCAPFTMARVQYFDAADVEKARAWLDGA